MRTIGPELCKHRRSNAANPNVYHQTENVCLLQNSTKIDCALIIINTLWGCFWPLVKNSTTLCIIPLLLHSSLWHILCLQRHRHQLMEWCPGTWLPWAPLECPALVKLMKWYAMGMSVVPLARGKTNHKFQLTCNIKKLSQFFSCCSWGIPGIDLGLDGDNCMADTSSSNCPDYYCYCR